MSPLLQHSLDPPPSGGRRPRRYRPWRSPLRSSTSTVGGFGSGRIHIAWISISLPAPCSAWRSLLYGMEIAAEKTWISHMVEVLVGHNGGSWCRINSRGKRRGDHARSVLGRWRRRVASCHRPIAAAWPGQPETGVTRVGEATAAARYLFLSVAPAQLSDRIWWALTLFFSSSIPWLLP